MTIFQPVNDQLGYCFHPPAAGQTFGHSQLDVVIRPAPTKEHFDPESFTCFVAASGGSVKLHVTHPWNQETTFRICAGEIDVEDARREHVRAFTFGGTLQIKSDVRYTVCQIASPAPLLEHARQIPSLEEQLIEEVYILFAERRAVQDEDVLQYKLAAADPLQLYHACLMALHEKFAHFPAADDTGRHFTQFLHTAARSLAAEVIPALSDLL